VISVNQRQKESGRMSVSLRMRIGFITASVALMAIASNSISYASPSAASTSGDGQGVDTIVIQQRSHAEYGSTMQIRLNSPISRQKATEIRRALETSVGQSNAVAPMTTGSGTIWCNGHYWWADNNGRFDIERGCGSSNAPWGLRLSAYAQSIVGGSGYVQELGMDWTRNGVRQGRMAPHTAFKNYQFHGTFNGIANGTVVEYADVIHFPCNLGRGCQATASFYGTLTFSATVWHP